MKTIVINREPKYCKPVINEIDRLSLEDLGLSIKEILNNEFNNLKFEIHCYTPNKQVYAMANEIAQSYPIKLVIQAIPTELNYNPKNTFYNSFYEALNDSGIKTDVKIHQETMFPAYERNGKTQHEVTDDMKKFIETYCYAYGYEMPNLYERTARFDTYSLYTGGQYIPSYSATEDNLNKPVYIKRPNTVISGYAENQPSEWTNKAQKTTDFRKMQNLKPASNETIFEIYTALKFLVDNHFEYIDGYENCQICGKPYNTTADMTLTKMLHNGNYMTSCQHCDTIYKAKKPYIESISDREWAY